MYSLIGFHGNIDWKSYKALRRTCNKNLALSYWFLLGKKAGIIGVT